MSEYRENVELLFDLDSSSVFKNGLPEHAAIILQVFLERAQGRVSIFCKNLLREVYDSPELLVELRKALIRGVDVEILLQDEPDAKDFMCLAKRLKSTIDIPGNISIRQSDPKKDLLTREYAFNFAVMDQKGYRFEADRNATVASACANDENTSRKLLRFFENMKRNLVGSDLLLDEVNTCAS